MALTIQQLGAMPWPLIKIKKLEDSDYMAC